MEGINQFTQYCPRCDRPYYSTVSKEAALDRVKEHVTGQHPDFDPLWYETYPEAEDVLPAQPSQELHGP